MLELKLSKGANMPEKKTEGSAGYDLEAYSIKKCFKGSKEIPEDRLKKIADKFEEAGYLILRKGERLLIGTGIKINHMPKTHEIQVRSRSGMVLKKGLFVMNSPGTIDSDYRGEICVILCNSTDFLIRIDKGERIAQMVMKRCEDLPMKLTEKTVGSSRGEGGFGSTGE